MYKSRQHLSALRAVVLIKLDVFQREDESQIFLISTSIEVQQTLGNSNYSSDKVYVHMLFFCHSTQLFNSHAPCLSSEQNRSTQKGVMFVL